MNILSLFDGISCGRLALDRAQIPYTNYYSSEIDKYALQISNKHFPDNIQLGNVKDVQGKDLPNIDLLMAGFPCTNLSSAGNRQGLLGSESSLFYECLRLIKETNPTYFLIENVIMKKEWENAISKELGVFPLPIDSALVSAQSRRRLYWTNIPYFKDPEHTEKYVKDILEDGHKFIDKEWYPYPNHRKKSELEPVRVAVLGNATNYKKKERQQSNRIYSVDGKAVTLRASTNSSSELYLLNNKIIALTPLECERLQTLPDNFTEGVTNTQRYKMIGNGWTIDIISHILKGMYT